MTTKSFEPRQACAGVTWVATVAIACVFVCSPAASAQPAFNSHAQNRYSATTSERMQQLSRELEMLAARARDEAKLDERHGGRDDVTHRMDDFAKRAHDLRLLVHERGVPASKMNDEIRQLVDDGRKVQEEWAKAKRRNPQTVADWDRTLAVLTDINNEFMAASGLVVRPDISVGTSGTFPNPAYNQTWANSGQMLLSDLDRHADDALRLSQNSSLDATADLQALRDQVRFFGRQIDQMPFGDAHDRIVRMLADARAVQRRLGNQDVPTPLRDDVGAMVGTLVQMRDLTGDRAEGTGGFTPAPGIDRERYAAMDPPQLSSELNRRVMRASELATDANLDDASAQIAHFRDKFRDFNTNAARMDRDERRDNLANLLDDAQATQRDLARQRVPPELVNQWNAVVDLLVRLRDAS